MPERTVRVIGAALAETLVALHAHGVTHAGVSPAAVLLTADGPRLTCFGAARTTDRSETADRIETTGRVEATDPIDREAQAPERATGGLPRPPGDIHGLGTVLAYAATGHAVPERDELPPALRPTISACLTRDPAHRPDAAALFPALAPPTPHGTVLGSASSLLAPGWLPARVVAALAHQSAALLSAELTEPHRTSTPNSTPSSTSNSTPSHTPNSTPNSPRN
ncbi:hypothetical protein ACIRSU_34195 [Streptomyces sp. NPDC101160]|uniref:hypothetical protein n=1 Tax=Streptomyces sp. NPDC101160 TaxID=3366118 RepID=UPI003801DEFA